MHAAMQSFKNSLAYFAMAVSYTCKMFMKLTPDGQCYKTFLPAALIWGCIHRHHDTQHNDIEHKGTQHNGIQYNNI